MTGPGSAPSTLTATPKSESFFSISREVNSSVSGPTSAPSRRASSRSFSGGSGVSGRSSKSGACFSFCTRSDFLISGGGGATTSAGGGFFPAPFAPRPPADLADLAIAPLLPDPPHQRERAFEHQAGRLRERDPRDPGEQAETDRDQRHQDERRTGKAEHARRNP